MRSEASLNRRVWDCKWSDSSHSLNYMKMASFLRTCANDLIQNCEWIDSEFLSLIPYAH